MRYDYRCPKCGIFEIWMHMESVTPKIPCVYCKTESTRVYAPLPHKVDFKPGEDPGLGKYINTKKERDWVAGELGLRRVKD